jgi:hypothetical protein
MHYALKVDLHSQNRFLKTLWPDQVRENVNAHMFPLYCMKGQPFARYDWSLELDSPEVTLFWSWRLCHAFNGSWDKRKV